ncbi:MAG TPA: hypothetical protein VEC35_10420 [Noviherbaspirillum sp.]|nr:hypothetical protein [Noviherbaspirillum sp.]
MSILLLAGSPSHMLALDPAITQRVSDGVAHLFANLHALRVTRSSEFAPVLFSQVRCSV